jgi:hypothetical protein
MTRPTQKKKWSIAEPIDSFVLLNLKRFCVLKKEKIVYGGQ